MQEETNKNKKIISIIPYLEKKRNREQLINDANHVYMDALEDIDDFEMALKKEYNYIGDNTYFPDRTIEEISESLLERFQGAKITSQNIKHNINRNFQNNEGNSQKTIKQTCSRTKTPTS